VALIFSISIAQSRNLATLQPCNATISQLCTQQNNHATFNATITQPCNTTITQHCNATLQRNNHATLQRNNHATSQRNNNATLQSNNHATMQCNNHVVDLLDLEKQN
jgi:surface antigen